MKERRKTEKKPPSRETVLKALRRENELARREQIRRWLSLPMERRVNFLRKRIGIASSAL